MEKPALGQIPKFLKNFLRNFRVILKEFTRCVDFEQLGFSNFDFNDLELSLLEKV